MKNAHSQGMFVIVDERHPLRHRIESLVTERYSVAFGANVHTFMPYFSCLLGDDDEILSVCGFRLANHEPLFLEQYLDAPAETLISRRFNQAADRRSLVEFGQLASFSRGLSFHHFTCLSQYLVNQGYRWCIFTATGPLYAMMRRFGLSPETLVSADASRVEKAERIWGSYYSHQPRVSAGDLVQGAAQLKCAQRDAEVAIKPKVLRGGTHG